MDKIVGIITGIFYHGCNMLSLYTAVAIFTVLKAFRVVDFI